MGSFHATRQALTGNVVAAILPPHMVDAVEVGNAGVDDLYIYSTAADSVAHTNYITVPIGFARSISLKSGRFKPDEAALYLMTPQNGTVVLIWL